ncbi:acyltransferase domain-containing protein [uncultured Desulfovibrio sp.]|uniref:acyltransferase domain-containing protein n=1 Tax=uncultured Desulfovibrio sp. TaxID=167968 RepID=UPI00262F8D17|nr:acyltransferase domain-containing protein [uncultured Desulfovibrio sp.]
MHQDAEKISPAAEPDEYALDGVRYAELRHAGRLWRIGAVTPTWRQELPLLSSDPDRATIARLEERGLWLAPEDGPQAPLAVMCCGLGSVWPGMGRELYDNFPAARAAMDRIAAVADWDILGLMDETDAEKISLTRWQCPYLFMLEFAQWSVLTSLGLKPALICGHSLGELIGLCLAGIYAPETAWYILDTRAVHMAELEANATCETGMMAVHADAGVIREAQATWPALYVSNYNTPRQFILSGPREVLLEARKSLRKRRIPAIVLNVSLAFHHPAMRVLRDLSLRHLNALNMRAPQFPMLSCITTDFYPDDQESICRHIADLDENSVRWTECVETVWQRDGIRMFLELGPQDTLCSLVADNRPDARCLAAGRKGRETEGLRQACARLYSLGYLRREAVARRVRAETGGEGACLRACAPAPHCSPMPPDGATPRLRTRPVESAANAQDADSAAAPIQPETSSGPSPVDCLAVVTAAIARACGRPAAELRPEMDLRYDLSLRSSRFPLIVQDVEKALHCSVNFEHLLQVSTIGDLARALAGGAPPADADAGSAPRATEHAGCNRTPPLVRYAPLAARPTAGGEPAALAPLPLDACGSGLPLHAGDVLAVWAPDARILPRLLRGLAPLGCVLGVPAALLEACASLSELGARLVPLDMPASFPAERMTAAAPAAVDALAEACGRVDGVFLAPSLGDGTPDNGEQPGPEAETRVAALLRSLVTAARPHGLKFVCCCAVQQPVAENCVCDGPLQTELRSVQSDGLPVLSIRLLHGAERTGLDEWGDMLAREMLRGDVRCVIWARPGTLSAPVIAPEPRRLRRERPQCFPLTFADPHPPYATTAELFQDCCHFSCFADPTLNEHVGRGWTESDASFPRLPVCRTLEALLEGALQALPWLKPTGFCDVRFHGMPELPPGVARECRLAVEAEPWLMQDGVMTRMCRGRLAVRRLTPNGRRAEGYAPVMEGRAWLAARVGAVPPLWPHPPAAAGASHIFTDTEHFYDIVGPGPAWRLTRSFATLPDHMFLATLHLPETAIAPQTDCAYTDHLFVVEGIVQAVRLALTHQGSGAFSDAAAMLAALARWRLNGMGFIRFGAPRAPGPVQTLLRRSWADGRLLRFDAQAADCRGNVFLTIHHLELDRRDPAMPSASLA